MAADEKGQLEQSESCSGLISESEKVYVWQQLLHEDRMIVQRASFFLVAESMLLIAHANLRGGGREHSWTAAFALAILGFFISSLWLFIAYRQLKWYQIIRDALLGQNGVIGFIKFREFHKRWNREIRPLIFWGRNGGQKAFPSFRIMAYFIPPIFMMVWLFLILILVL
jgi:hypothetical protein